jgi:hypothetical protein
MQVEPLDPGNPVALAPAIRRTVGAADEQPVQYREEHCSLQREVVLARVGQPRGNRSPPTPVR